MITPAWTSANPYEDIAAFHVFVNGVQVDEKNASVLRYDLYGLTSNTAYAFQVKAAFMAGSNASSLESNIVSESTSNRSHPGAADPPTLLEVSGGFIRARAQPPKDTGGANITTLTMLVRSTVDFAVVSLSQPPTQPEFIFYGLDARTEYFLSTYATNAGNLSGSESGFLSATTLALHLAGPCPPPTVLGATGSYRTPVEIAFVLKLMLTVRSMHFVRCVHYAATKPSGG